MTLNEQQTNIIDLGIAIIIASGLSAIIYYYRNKYQSRQNTQDIDGIQYYYDQDQEQESFIAPGEKNNFSKHPNLKEQLDLLIRNTHNVNRCQIDPNCEFVWIHDPNSFKGQIYCPLCDEYDNSSLKTDPNKSNDSSLLSLTVECVYCSLQTGGHYVVSCGCTYHEECLQKIIGLSSGLPSIKCVHCTKKIHKGLIKSRLLNEEQKNQLFDNQLAIIKQGNYCKSGYFKCKNCGELYNQDQCRCQSINLL